MAVMSRNKKLAVVVLNWNCADDSIKCIESLLLQSSHTPSIVVVDNHSSDDSVDVLEAYISTKPDQEIALLRSPANGGYAAGNNIGFMYALEHDYEYIGTLNPDAVADRHWCSALLDELKNHDDVIIATGLMIQDPSNKIDTSGELYYTWGIPSPRNRGLPPENAPKHPEYIFASTGGGFIARAAMLRDVGIFDERFFMYFEDVDLSFRAQLAGYKIRYTPKASAYHKVSVSTKKVPGLGTMQTFKNLPVLFVKNVPLSLWPHMYPRFMLSYTLILGNAIMHGSTLPALKGWLRSWLLLPHMVRERRYIQKSRRVSDAYISSIILHDIPPEQTGMRKFRKFFTGRD